MDFSKRKSTSLFFEV